MKYQLGAARGGLKISADSPKVSGAAHAQAAELAKKTCIDFDLRVAATGDLVRGTKEALQWIDVDDHCFQIEADGQPVTKTVRLFSKFVERLEPSKFKCSKPPAKRTFTKNGAKRPPSLIG